MRLWEREFLNRGRYGPSTCERENYFSVRFNSNHTCLDLGNGLDMAQYVGAGADSMRVLGAGHGHLP